MLEMLALTAAASALLSLTIYLLLLKTQISGRRPMLALTRRWVTARPTTSAGILAFLMTSTGVAFVVLPTLHPTVEIRKSGAMPGSAPGPAVFDQDEELTALRKFAKTLDDMDSHAMPEAAVTNLPGVDQMIENLLRRLEREPGDVRGWKMLGWSYLNTGRPSQAAQAYETALKLTPGDREITAALEAVRAAQSPTDDSPAAKR
jgi:cytochrome c-type biogenesis protein CcmH